jgi:D-alanyl-D-alanine carboxypeptidase (penicillin-binding protein 5/6)
LIYNALLAVLLLASLATHSTGLVEDYNAKLDNFSKVTPKNNKSEAVDWQQKLVSIAAKNDQTGFSTDAKSYLAVDLANGQVLEKRNEDTRLPVASLTKLMTAYVILRGQPLEKEMSVPAFSVRQDDSLMGISQNEKLTVRDLLRGLLVNSGSDAAQTLAINDSGSNQAFVVKMNSESQRIGLANTHFDNPVGWDSQNNYSSAKDMAILARILLNNDFFKETVSKKSLIVTTKGGRQIKLVNTNLLLNDSDIVGVKTGFTNNAGECLVNLRVKDGHSIMTVVIGSRDRFGQTRSFLDWIYSHFSW